MRRLAVLSLHTSPLAQPGTGDGGGMNVYVRELASALARTGAQCDVFTRASSPDLAAVVVVEPGLVVHHVKAGPVAPMAKERLPAVVDEFTEGVLAAMTRPGGLPLGDEEGGRFEAIHANYWLSGLSGHTIKHELDLPLVATFHTLDRVKAEAGPEEVASDIPHRRAEAEASIIRCSDAVLASCTVEAEQIAELYGADPTRIEVVAPGVDHAFFGPGHRPQARRALGLPADGTLLLFVGRIQPLKGAELAVRTLAELCSDGGNFRLVVVGGPSGPQGPESYERMIATAKELGVADRLVMVAPQPHELLSTYYRAADVCLVRAGPSPSGSSPWRPRPAARRWWPRRSAASPPWSTRAARASSSMSPPRRPSLGGCARSWPTRSPSSSSRPPRCCGRATTRGGGRPLGCTRSSTS